MNQLQAERPVRSTATSFLAIAGTGSYLPQTRLDVEAVAQNYIKDGDRIRATGYQTICAEQELYPPDMALIAAHRALADAGVGAQDISVLIVTAIHRHGHKRFWSPASWLQSQLGCPQALPLTINQGCNGQLIGVEIAGRYIRDTEGAALVVATDQFSSSVFDRFTSDYGIIYGDGAAAAVLSHGPDRAGWRILRTHTVSAPDLEGLHRAAEPGPETAAEIGNEHNVRAAKARFLADNGTHRLRDGTRTALQGIRAALLDDDALSPGPNQIRRIVYPNLGLKLLTENYFDELPGGAERSLWTFGSTTGHLGSADQIAGLDHLARSGEIARGERVLLLGAGAGFTWTGMLLERR